MLRVNEIFYSIQGESTRAGLPCVFIRLTGCNLRCAWCDTRYAYEKGEDLSIRQILEKVAVYPCRLVEITGGEPLLQEKTPELAGALTEAGYTVLVETNGSLPVAVLPEAAVRIMDIKCPSSGESEQLLMENLEALRPDDEIKCVIADRMDYEWAAALIRENRLEGRCRILFSPVESRLMLSDLASWILEDGIHVRLQPQLHKTIWPGEERGR